MDIKRFFKLIRRYLAVLILVPLIAASATYFLCRDLPKQYKSDVQIATGLVDQSKQVVAQQQADFFKISQQFSNIIEKMKMRKIMSILSYNLILHDLSDPKTKFRAYSPKIDSMSVAERAELQAIFADKLAKKISVTVLDNKGKYKLYDILGSMRYDDGSLSKEIVISRPENSDFINVEFSSENPLLSAYVVNTLATEFIKNYGIDVNSNQNNSIQVLDSVLKQKQQVMDAKNSALKAFKMKNGVLNVNEQAATLYASITQYEERRAQALRDIQANRGALANINAKLRGVGDPYVSGSVVQDNNTILNLKNQLKTANDRYIDGGFKPSDKRRVDSLQSILAVQSSRNSDKNVVEPQVARQGLIQQKINLEIATAQTTNTINSITTELGKLKSQYSTMVPFDAGIQNYERDAEIATKDYVGALDRSNQTRTDQNTGLRLEIAQVGLPGVALPSKAILYVALAGIASLFFCFAGLLTLFLMDGAVYTTAELSKRTGSPVLGLINFLRTDDMTPRVLWSADESKVDHTIYKDLIRSLRFEIDKEFSKNKCTILGVTSLHAGEGKSFLSSSLVYAFAMTGKKVLLISSEQQPGEKVSSQKLLPSEFFDSFLVKKEIKTEDLITVFNSKASNASLLETQSTDNLNRGFDVLKKEFDIIIVDINSLSVINNAKEWLYFTDRSIAVFEAGKSITDGDQELLEFMRNQPGFMGWILNKVKEKNNV